MDEAAFSEMHSKDQMAVDKLKEGIDGFAKVRFPYATVTFQLYYDCMCMCC